MLIVRVVSAALTAVGLVAAVPATAGAQFTRTYVSPTGSDANTCAVASPCATFQRAADQATTGGEVNALSPGNYSAFTITKALTVDGGPGNLATITPFGSGVTVNAPDAKVTLRNLRINGRANGSTGAGIDVVSASTVRMEDLRVSGFGSRPGILFGNTGVTRAFVVDSALHANYRGLTVRPAAGGTTRVTVRRTDVDDNGYGVIADGRTNDATAIVNISDSAITESGIGPTDLGYGLWSVGSKAVIRSGDNQITANRHALRAEDGGQLYSDGGNRVFGNVVKGAFTATFGTE